MSTGRHGRPNRQRGRFQPQPPNQRSQQPHHHPDHPAYTTVPPYAAVHPGTGVFIVLKEDQPTSRQVSGIVADLLTRGDHPRGVKVRLRDGRVGRVQGLVSAEEGERGEASVGGLSAGLGRNGESAGARGRGMGSGRGGIRGGRTERDIRDEDEYLYDESRGAGPSDGLFAALEAADKKHKESKRVDAVGTGEAVKIVHCPVCRDFEGDEVAVAHHVEEHFGS